MIADSHLFDNYSADWRQELNMDCEQYANFFVRNWNTFTDPGDVIIHVGDVGAYCEQTVNALKQLHGTILLVLGNHDSEWVSYAQSGYIFKGIHEYIKLDNVFIQHIPIFDSSIREEVTYLVHGHHHRYDVPNMRNTLRDYARDVHRLNCAADMNNHKPCTLQELILNKELLLDNYQERGIL